MKTLHPAVLLLTIGLLVAFSSVLMKDQASAAYASGIGIRKEGPLKAGIGDIIEYAITIYNLGDFYISNITITDVFPNGTSVNWTVPYLAPQGHTGDSFKISRIMYTVDFKDVFPTDTDSPHVVNHAEVTGYVYIDGLSLLVRAETQFPTFIYAAPVGGYTVRIKATDPSTPTTLYFVLISVMTAAFAVFRLSTADGRKFFKRLEE